MAEPILTTRSSVALLRRRWRLVAVGGGVGAVLGLLYAIVVPGELTSTSMVQIQGGVQSSSGGGGVDIDTQVRLVESRRVLERAGRAVQPNLSVPRVEQSVSAEAATPQLIEIRASSARASQAQALAQAVAQAYVGTTAATSESVTDANIKDLRAREERLNEQFLDLQEQIGAINQRIARETKGTTQEETDSRLLADLTSQQAAAALQWEQIKRDLASSTSAGLNVPASIVQPATPATGPGLLSRLLSSAATGALLLGALVAAGLLVRARRDPRLRTRDEFADAVGSTVLADVRSRPQRSVAEWSTLFRTYEASAVDAWAFRQVLRSLAASPGRGSASGSAGKRLPGRIEHPASVTVVTLAGDRHALAVGPQLASFAASLGIATRFVAATGHPGAASLQAACSSDGASLLRAGLLLEARVEDHGPLEGERGLPAGSFDELLEGLVLASRDDDDVEDAEDDVDDDVDDDDVEDEAEGGAEGDAEARRRSETLWRVDDVVVDDPHPVAAPEAPAGETPEPAREPAPRPAAAAEPATVPEAPAQPVAPVSAMRVIPKHGLTDLTVVVVVADRRAPTLRGVPDTAVTVLAISPDVGNREELARLAVAVDDAGRRIDGIIVADPDSTDATTGRRTLDVRALETPLPVRTTGVSQLPVAGGDRGRNR